MVRFATRSAVAVFALLLGVLQLGRAETTKTGGRTTQPSAGSYSDDRAGLAGSPRAKLPKYQDKIVFVGQLPYDATREQVENFFSRKGFASFTIRMLTDKTPERAFRGIAFVEFSRAADAAKALKLDHNLFGNRRIRVEKTATGGGNNRKRKDRLVRSKQQQEQERTRQIEGMLDRIFARRDAKSSSAAPADSTAALQDDPSVHPSRRHVQPPPGRARDISTLMTRQDCDDTLVRYLCSLPDRVASKVARACSRLEVGAVENRGAYAMGMVKRKLRKAEKKAKRRLLRSDRGAMGLEPVTRAEAPEPRSSFYD